MGRAERSAERVAREFLPAYFGGKHFEVAVECLMDKRALPAISMH